MNSLPKHRLDAGSFGTMGVGLGFAIASALYVRWIKIIQFFFVKISSRLKKILSRDHCPDKVVVCIEGDSAFGFSGMEMETMVRYRFHEFFKKSFIYQ